MACENCKHYLPMEMPDKRAPAQGQCRANPPQVIAGIGMNRISREPMMVAQTAWPVVLADQVCGRFEQGEKLHA